MKQSSLCGGMRLLSREMLMIGLTGLFLTQRGWSLCQGARNARRLKMVKAGRRLKRGVGKSKEWQKRN